MASSNKDGGSAEEHGSGVGGSGAFPDLHHKMSKKIAQLTKVIYILNTKADEHRYEMKALEDAYEAEIEQVLKSAYEKINGFRKQLEQSNEGAAVKFRAMLDSQKERFAAERSAATSRLEGLLKEWRHREAAQKAVHEEQLQQLKQKVVEQQNFFNKRMQDIEGATIQVEKRYAANIGELKEKHTQELKELVQQGNDRFNRMVAEKLSQEDALKAKLSASETESSQKTTKINELQAQISLLQRQLTENSRIITSTKADLEIERTSAQKRDERRVSDIAHLEDELQKHKQQAAHLNSELESSILSVQELQRLCQSKDLYGEELKQQIASLQDTLARDRESATSTLSDRAKREKVLSQELEATKKRAAELLASLDSINATSHKQRDELSQATTRIEALLSEKSRLENVNYDRATQITDLKAELTQTQEKLKASQARAAELTSSLQRESAAREQLSQRLQRAQREVQQLRDEAQASGTVSQTKSHELRDAQTQIAQLQSALVSSNASVALLEKQLSQANAQLYTLDEESRAAAKEYERALGQRQAEIAALTQSLDAKSSANEALGEEVVSSKQAIGQLQSQLSALQSKVQELQAIVSRSVNVDSHSALQTEVKERDDIIRKTTEDLRNATKLLEQARTEKDGLIATINKLRVDYAEEQQRKEQEFNRRLVALRLDAQAAATSSENSLRGELLTQLEHAQRTAAQDRLSLQTEIAGRDAQLSALSTQLESVQAALRSKEAEVANLIGELTRTRGDLQRTTARLFSLEHEHAECDGKLAAADKRFRLHTEQNESALNAERALLSERLHTSLKEQSASLHKQRETELEALRAQLTQQYAQQKAQLEKAHQSDKENAITAVKQPLTSEIEALQAMLSAKTAEADGLVGDLSQSRTLREQLSQRIERLQGEFAQERDEVKRKQQAERAATAEQFRKELAAAVQYGQNELESVRAQCQRDINEAEARVVEWQKKFELMRSKYNERESRPEDLMLIQELHRKAEVYLAERKQAIEEMRYYKLELQNREDTYNKTFNRQPVVGVIRPRGGEEGSSRSKKSVSILSLTSNNSTSSFPPLPSARRGSVNGEKGGAHSYALKESLSKASKDSGERQWATHVPSHPLHPVPPIAISKSISSVDGSDFQ